jgi:hypothetical protein
VEVGIVVALVVVLTEVAWLAATHRIYREEPPRSPQSS